ncbi:type III-A CRISPR-associated RAMP protein Csm3 [Marinithermus hydrothermalis]|uniref:CRISPR system Cms endoribonuclease Csm3 n=1 Tax=Marinithermus hydrothermalis (strain DSM 14884 / JCM 11576 / T1) TaxID=869210 RepID=F2NNA1_MARHT|nr:type III-A CRISPR-associated RAMP protein Csm3 [Marinithermus hydrothermalis]AEB10942.1 CRISPR-associated RAMP protein, Csm3 family [Marinithermus hydrothermalis DSM 14884]
MRLLKLKVIRGELEAKTGLRIGGSREGLEIGGVDNPVIRNPLTGEPYVPGSSIKGKMRSLIEWSLGDEYLVDDTKHTHSCTRADCPVCRVFGSTAADSRPDQGVRGPTRLIVRDAYLTPASRQALQEMNLERGTLFTEIKQEVFIPRLGGDANPRTMERVPAGTRFEFEMVYKVFDTGDGGQTDEQYFEEIVQKGLRLLELDALGGSTSRGYGQIRFRNLEILEIDAQTGQETRLEPVREG